MLFPSGASVDTNQSLFIDAEVAYRQANKDSYEHCQSQASPANTALSRSICHVQFIHWIELACPHV